jgi:deoxycytidine triphosphate deaminase
MFGNLITNRQLKALRMAGEISIDPFDEPSVKATHYTLHAGRILSRHADGTWRQIHNFDDDSNPFSIEPNAYVLVEVKEFIKIKASGIVGRFIQTSNFIESGLSLIAGQVDSQYGMKGERLRFGVKNLMSNPNTISSSTRIAHVEFFDLRGITTDPVKFTEEEVNRWSGRMLRAMDGGVDYGDGS